MINPKSSIYDVITSSYANIKWNVVYPIDS